ncbi:ABC transporter permease [Rhodoferax aquaticus]|uniref:ABC transporter permease n=1 Tax=Rhodoferax aquaticus TaxID=2527691 RepID=A0A515EJD7_9BURK|nr:ABC transporter permease [Rhodoferax aquaticus]QDL52783.1 ABC transporter permease [Rhodoferax aquaticus]
MASTHRAPPTARALWVLAAVGALVLLALPLLSASPNRLLSGKGVALWSVAAQVGWAALLPLASLFISVVLAGSGWLARRWQNVAFSAGLLSAAISLLSLAALVGGFATVADVQTEGLGRTTLGSGFWVFTLVLWLTANELMRQLQWQAVQRTAAWALLAVGIGALGLSGSLDALSTVKEYSARAEDFWRAWGQHLHIMGYTVALTLGVGLPLGVYLQRTPRWSQRFFVLLSGVQTIPSIALFSVLMALLAALGKAWPLLPALGLHGVGMAPAVLALCAYALLPLVRSVVAGLQQVPRAIHESAQAMGLSARQTLWQVELPLALPLVVSGVKVMVIQTIGLTAVAALIGAGGLGSLMFEGLFSSAMDLVVLAVFPIVAMAWLAEGLLSSVATACGRWARHTA